MLLPSELDLRKLWTQMVKDAEQDLNNCPEHLHAECPRANAHEWFLSPQADKVFDILWPDNGAGRLRITRSRLQPCKHKLERERLAKLWQ